MATSTCTTALRLTNVTDTVHDVQPCGQPDRAGYRELRKRGVSVREAWNTSKNAGPWRLSKTPALSLALPARFFRSLGLPSLAG